MYAIRSYYALQQRIDELEAEYQLLKERKDYLVQRNGDLESRLNEVVITSYSIHYTKLYENDAKAVQGQHRFYVIDGF